jgi:uncharacterized Zn finger protein (UPF0148 family)
MACMCSSGSSHVVAMTLEEKMERQDASIKKMAKALREGARMLDIACPVCNNPIFQFKSGEKMCVSCERKVIFEGETQQKGKDNAPSSINEVVPTQGASEKKTAIQAEMVQNSISTILPMLKERCGAKLASMVAKMERTTDENELSVIYANILKVIEILKQISLL